MIRNNLSILSILLLALILRAWGINHGFPFLYHPDEPTIVREALALKVHHFNPGHFDWPHLQIYLSFLFFIPLYLFKIIFNIQNFIYPDPVDYYLLARLLTVLMGSATIFFIYSFGKRLFSEKIGLFSALFLALNTVHVSESHVATVDVPMNFWLTLSLVFSAKILKEGKLKDYLLAGLFAGFATSTKYNAGLVVLPIAAGHILRIFRPKFPSTYKDLRESILKLKELFLDFKKAFLLTLAAISGFFLGTPFAFFDYKTFLFTESPKGALWQFYHVGDSGLAGGVLERYAWLINENLVASQGIFISFLSLLGIYILVSKKLKSALILIPFPLLYFLYIGHFTYAPPHYFLPVYPFLSILAAIGFQSVATRLREFFLLDEIRVRQFVALLLVLIAVPPLFSSIKEDYILTQKDTRTQAREWLVKNFAPATTFALGGDYEPDLDNTGFDTIFLKEILEGKDLSGAIYPYFHGKKVNYVILGGFDLEKELKEVEWDPEKPNFTHYVLAKGGKLKRFDPVMHPGPMVLIYEIDYKWEVTSGRGFENEE